MNIRQCFPAMLILMLISITAFSARAQTAGSPYMPATPKKVLADIGAPADVQAVVSGGWGYGKADVMVIGYPYENDKKFFDVRSFESDLIDMRNMEEFYTVPEDGKRFLPMKCLIIRQSEQTGQKGQRFDIAEATLDLLPEEYWPELEKLSKTGADDEHILSFFQGKLVTVNRTYWFDITKPFNSNKKVFSNTEK